MTSIASKFKDIQKMVDTMMADAEELHDNLVVTNRIINEKTKKYKTKKTTHLARSI